MARDTIEVALRDGRHDGLEGAELLARVDASYPFGERRNFPYKVWLDQRKKQCWSLLPERSRRGRRPRVIDERLEQLEEDMRRVARGDTSPEDLLRRGLAIGERAYLGDYTVSRFAGPDSPCHGLYLVSRADPEASPPTLFLWPDGKWYRVTGIGMHGPEWQRGDYPAFYDNLEEAVDHLMVATLSGTAEVCHGD